MKEVHAAPPASESVGVNASQWDIYDTFVKPAVSKSEQLTKACRQQAAQTVATCLRKPGCLLKLPEESKDKKGTKPAPGQPIPPGGAKSPHGTAQSPTPSHKQSGVERGSSHARETPDPAGGDSQVAADDA